MTNVYQWRDQREVLGEAIKAEFKRQIDTHRNAWNDMQSGRKWWMPRTANPDPPIADFEALAEAAIVEVQKWPSRHAGSF